MTTTLADRFAIDGYATPFRVMSDDDARSVVAQLERVERKLGPRVFAQVNMKAHLVLPFLWDLVHHERIVGVVSEILGPDILCWGSSFFAKDANAADHVPWHQDGTCWGLDAPKGLTAWLALTPSTVESGCLRVLPGSHHDVLRHAVRNASSSMLPLGEEIVAEVDESQVVDCPLQPGEMSLHHVMLAHGSATNKAQSGRRIGFAIRYIAGSVAQKGDEKGFATLVRGRDHGTYHLEQKPEAELSPSALRHQRQVVAHSARLVTREAERLD